MNASMQKLAMILSTAAVIPGLMLLASSPGWAQQTTLKGQLVGAWTLVSIEVTPKSSGAKRPGFGGPNAKGILILDASGRYAQVTGNPERPKLKTTVRKDMPAAELGEAARTFGARFGNWSVNEAGKTLMQTTELQMVANEAAIEIKAAVALAGDELKLVTVSPGGGTTEFIYRRAR